MLVRRRCRREERGEPCVGIGSVGSGVACSGRSEIVRWRMGRWVALEVGEEEGGDGEDVRWESWVMLVSGMVVGMVFVFALLPLWALMSVYSSGSRLALLSMSLLWMWLLLDWWF